MSEHSKWSIFSPNCNIVKWSGLIPVLALGITMLICSGFKPKPDDKGKDIVLRLEPGPNNPRNSEGDFISLKDKRILFVYSH